MLCVRCSNKTYGFAMCDDCYDIINNKIIALETQIADYETQLLMVKNMLKETFYFDSNEISDYLAYYKQVVGQTLQILGEKFK